MTRYRHETFKTDNGYGYRILDGDREVLRTKGSFKLKRDAAACAAHFAADDDLEVLLANRK